MRSSAVSAAISAVTEGSPSTVAFVSSNISKSLTVNGAPVRVNMLGGKQCFLFAMIDTGSRVSFIISSVFTRYFGRSLSKLNPSSRNFTAVNNTPVEVCGTFQSTIGFEQIPETEFKIGLQILSKDNLGTHLIIIIGRDLLDLHDIVVTVV